MAINRDPDPRWTVEKAQTFRKDFVVMDAHTQAPEGIGAVIHAMVVAEQLGTIDRFQDFAESAGRFEEQPRGLRRLFRNPFPPRTSEKPKPPVHELGTKFIDPTTHNWTFKYADPEVEIAINLRPPTQSQSITPGGLLLIDPKGGLTNQDYFVDTRVHLDWEKPDGSSLILSTELRGNNSIAYRIGLYRVVEIMKGGYGTTATQVMFNILEAQEPVIQVYLMGLRRNVQR